MDSLKNMPAIDWVATLTAIAYIFFAAREQIICWYFGIISCGLWAYSSFFNYELYLDAILNVFYVIMAFVGIYQWKYGAKDKKTLNITKMDTALHFKIILAGIVFGLLYGYLFDKYTAAEATYLDALTTVFAIITTFLVIQKKLENWIYWIFINSVYIYLYGSRGAYLFALIMIIYIVIAISGYKKWKENMVV
jgi:nicotinamide mononucleotide transporter